MNLGLLRRFLDFGIGRAILAEPDILADRHVEQHVLLEHHSHAGAQGVARHLAYIDTVDTDPALVRLIQTQDQVEQRALAGAARPHNRDILPGAELERQTVENRIFAAFIFEDHTIKRNVVGDARQIRRAGAIRTPRRLVKQLFHVANGCRRLNRHRDEVHQMRDVVGDFPECALKCDERADGNLADGGEIGADGQHNQMQQQHRNGNGPLHHRGQECRVRH